MLILVLAGREGSVQQLGPTLDADEASVGNAAGVHMQGLHASAACDLDLARYIYSRETWASVCLQSGVRPASQGVAFPTRW